MDLQSDVALLLSALLSTAVKDDTGGLIIDNIREWLSTDSASTIIIETNEP